jgi:hypothetical protein
VHRVCWGGDKIEIFVEAPRLFVFCVHGKGAYSGYVRCLQRALHRVSQECLADTLALPAIDSKMRQSMMGKMLRRAISPSEADLARSVRH